MEDELIGKLDDILRSSRTRRTRNRGAGTRRGTGTTSAATAEDRPPMDWRYWQGKVEAAIQSSPLRQTVRVVYGSPAASLGLGTEHKWSTSGNCYVYGPTKHRGRDEDGRKINPGKVPLGVWRLFLAKAEEQKANVASIIDGTISAYPERALAAGMDGKSGIDLLMNMVKDEEVAIAYQAKKMVGRIGKRTNIDIVYSCDMGKAQDDIEVRINLSKKEVGVSIGDRHSSRYGGNPSNIEDLQGLCSRIGQLDTVGKQTIGALSAINFSHKGGDTPDDDKVKITSMTDDD